VRRRLTLRLDERRRCGRARSHLGIAPSATRATVRSIASCRWFRVGVFHLVPEPLVLTLPEHVEALRDPGAAAVEVQHAVFSLPRVWSPINPHTLSVDLAGLSLELPVLDVEPVLGRLAQLTPLADSDEPVLTLAGDVPVLFLTEHLRRELSAALRAAVPGIQADVREDRETIGRSIEGLGPRRRALHA